MIPIFKPCMDQQEIDAVAEVLKSGWIGLGPKTVEFENKFAEYIGTKYAVGLNSCTSALDLAIRVLGIKSGEVITTPITFVSTAHAILYNNTIPVFADVYPDTLNIDPDDVRRKISKKTKAIIPVHYGGHPVEMDEIMEIAEKHNLFVIEDAAHACGAEYKGKKAGSIGDLGCFSFHAVKNLATGDGGMITTDDKKIYEHLLKLRWLGINKDTFKRDNTRYSWNYEVEELGYKMHMNDIAAAIGVVQLKKLDKMNASRRKIVDRYNEAFKKLDWLETPTLRKGVVSSHHNYAAKVVKGDRNDLIAHLAAKDISSGVHYTPLYLHPIYKKFGITAKCPVADEIWKKIIILPVFPDLGQDEMNHIINTVKTFQ